MQNWTVPFLEKKIVHMGYPIDFPLSIFISEAGFKM